LKFAQTQPSADTDSKEPESAWSADSSVVEDENDSGFDIERLSGSGFFRKLFKKRSKNPSEDA
jgi:hypothetical protein